MMLVKYIAIIENYITNKKRKKKKTTYETAKIFLDNSLTFSSLNFSKTRTIFLLSYFEFEVLNHFVHTSRKQRTKRKKEKLFFPCGNCRRNAKTRKIE